MTLRVGLTGGIASGKSTVSALFESLGVPVIDTDVISHQLMQIDQPGYLAAVKHFGQDVLSPDAKLDRIRLRQIIFEDDQEKQWLEHMLHPLIKHESIRQMQSHPEAAYVLLVVPLLYETGFDEMVDMVITIDCDPLTQIRRFQHREQLNQRQPDEAIVQKIIDSQMSNQQRIERADYVIPNSSDEDPAMDVRHIHQQIINHVENECQ